MSVVGFHRKYPEHCFQLEGSEPDRLRGNYVNMFLCGRTVVCRGEEILQQPAQIYNLRKYMESEKWKEDIIWILR